VFLKKLVKRFVFVVQIILVTIFIVFEELIWEGIAKPIYAYLQELHLLQSLQKRLETVNRYVILVIFLILLVSVEGAGLAAGVMAVRGMVIPAALLYALKIPIATFVFWLFHATESKLLSFGWFRWGYEKVMAVFSWIKSREIYQETIELAHRTKKAFKRFKMRYYSGDNSVSRRFRRLYSVLKKAINRKG